MRLVLASGSPRRRELLARIGLAFDVVEGDVDETLPEGVPLARAVAELALRKARTVGRRLLDRPSLHEGGPAVVVLGADTLVVLDGQPFGKPASRPDARRMLRALRGRTHEVLTGVAVIGPRAHEETETVRSRVTMHAFDDQALEAYLLTGEPDDKAGAYALQGVGRRLVRSVDGSASNVIGLPVPATVRLLRRAGLTVPETPEPPGILDLRAETEPTPGSRGPR